MTPAFHSKPPVRWNGTVWTPLAVDTGGFGVLEQAVFDPPGDQQGPAFYVAGDFSVAGGAAAPSIARLDDGGFSCLGDGNGMDGGAGGIVCL